MSLEAIYQNNFNISSVTPEKKEKKKKKGKIVFTQIKYSGQVFSEILTVRHLFLHRPTFSLVLINTKYGRIMLARRRPQVNELEAPPGISDD